MHVLHLGSCKIYMMMNGWFYRTFAGSQTNVDGQRYLHLFTAFGQHWFYNIARFLDLQIHNKFRNFNKFRNLLNNKDYVSLGGNYRVIGPVCHSVCVSVCLWSDYLNLSQFSFLGFNYLPTGTCWCKGGSDQPQEITHFTARRPFWKKLGNYPMGIREPYDAGNVPT